MALPPASVPNIVANSSGRYCCDHPDRAIGTSGVASEDSHRIGVDSGWYCIFSFRSGVFILEEVSAGRDFRVLEAQRQTSLPLHGRRDSYDCFAAATINHHFDII